MKPPRPYSKKAIFKREQERRKAQPTYSPTTDAVDYMWDNIEHYVSIEQEERDLRRKGMDPNFDWCSNHLRMAKAIRQNVNQGIQKGGRDHAVFFTFTFRHIPFGVSPFKYANACFRKAAKKFLPTHFQHWCRVVDVDKNGKPHFHGIGITHKPIFDGFDEEGYDIYMEASRSKRRIKELRQLRSMVSTNTNLRVIWGELDGNLGRFGFGPLHGVFPIRHLPAESGGQLRTNVAEYMVRMYFRTVPVMKRLTRAKVRAYQSSAKYPSKVRAKDIISVRWQESIKILMDIFGFEKQNQFGDLLGRKWGLTVSTLIDGLDSFTGRNGFHQDWRSFPLKDKAWLAKRLIFMIEHDQDLYDWTCALLPDLEECAETYQPHPDEPPQWKWVPVSYRACTCCPDPNIENISIVQPNVAAPN